MHLLEFVRKKNRQTVVSIEFGSRAQCLAAVDAIANDYGLIVWRPQGGPKSSRAKEIVRYSRIDADFWLIVSEDSRTPEIRAMRAARKCFGELMAAAA